MGQFAATSIHFVVLARSHKGYLQVKNASWAYSGGRKLAGCTAVLRRITSETPSVCFAALTRFAGILYLSLLEHYPVAVAG